MEWHSFREKALLLTKFQQPGKNQYIQYIIQHNGTQHDISSK